MLTSQCIRHNKVHLVAVKLNTIAIIYIFSLLATSVSDQRIGYFWLVGCFSAVTKKYLKITTMLLHLIHLCHLHTHYNVTTMSVSLLSCAHRILIVGKQMIPSIRNPATQHSHIKIPSIAAVSHTIMPLPCQRHCFVENTHITLGLVLLLIAFY